MRRVGRTRVGLALVAVLMAGALTREASAQGAATGAGERAAHEESLITRNQVRLNLAGAELIVREARAKAAEMELKVNIAVVDDGGHLLAFVRMDGARPASGYTAMTKASAAATLRAPTGPAGGETPNVLLSISLQNAAAASGGKFTALYGGVPVVVDGQVIGAVGVGGATGEQDAEIGRAGIAALLKSLGESK